MKILLVLNGWEKKIDLPEYIVAQGRVEVPLFPPMCILAIDKQTVLEGHAPISATFVYCGKKKRALPLFEFELG